MFLFLICCFRKGLSCSGVCPCSAPCRKWPTCPVLSNCLLSEKWCPSSLMLTSSPQPKSMCRILSSSSFYLYFFFHGRLEESLCSGPRAGCVCVFSGVPGGFVWRESRKTWLEWRSSRSVPCDFSFVLQKPFFPPVFFSFKVQNLKILK